MAVETKPLFNPELVRQQVHAFTLPDSVESARPRLQHWADTFKETALLPEFLTDIRSDGARISKSAARRHTHDTAQPSQRHSFDDPLRARRPALPLIRGCGVVFK